MHRYFKKFTQESSLPSSSRSENSPLQEECRNDASQPQQPINDANTNSIPFSTQRSRIDVSALPSDPGERKPMSQYHPDERDEVRRAYLQKGPFQPRNHAFPQISVNEYCRLLYHVLLFSDTPLIFSWLRH